MGGFYTGLHCHLKTSTCFLLKCPISNGQAKVDHTLKQLKEDQTVLPGSSGHVVFPRASSPAVAAKHSEVEVVTYSSIFWPKGQGNFQDSLPQCGASLRSLLRRRTNDNSATTICLRFADALRQVKRQLFQSTTSSIVLFLISG